MHLNRHHLIKTFGLLLLLVILARVDMGEVLDQLGRSDFRYLVPAVLLILPQVGLRALRWQRLLAQQGIQCPFSSALVFYFAAVYIGLITPGRIGELAKCFFLKQNRIAGVAQSLPSVVADRLLDLYVIGLLALGALCYLGLLPIPVWAAILLLTVCGGTPWLVLKWMQHHRGFVTAVERWLLRTVPRWQEPWRNLADGSRNLLTLRLGESITLTLLSYGIYFGQVCLIGRALDLPLGCGGIAMVTAIGILVGYIPITIAGLGTREAAFIYLFGRFGITAAEALGFAFWYNLVYIVCVGSISAVFWIRMPHRQAVKRNLKDSC